MRLASTSDRERLLATAFDAGITHFDVARMYGLGAAERELGRFIRDKRDRVTIATKAGILLGSASQKLQWIQPLARWVIGLHPKLRRLAQKSARGASGEIPRDYSVTSIGQSLETSRLELGVDLIDIFVLHEPRPQDLQDHALIDFLLEQQRKGRIGSVGLSGECDDAVAILSQFPALGEVVQIPSDIVSPSIDDLRSRAVKLPVTFSPFSRCLAPIQDYLKSDSAFTKTWSDRLNLTLTDPLSLARVLLAFNVQNNPGGITLFAATKPAQITSLLKEGENGPVVEGVCREFGNALRDRVRTHS